MLGDQSTIKLEKSFQSAKEFHEITKKRSDGFPVGHIVVKSYNANVVKEKNKKKFCQTCKDKGAGVFKCSTHNTVDHVENHVGNKRGKQYLDSAATTTFSPEKPDNLVPTRSPETVTVANGASESIEGEGTTSVGDIFIPSKYTPTLEDTLVSASQLLRQGAKIVMAQGLSKTHDVEVSINEKVVIAAKLTNDNQIEILQGEDWISAKKGFRGTPITKETAGLSTSNQYANLTNLRHLECGHAGSPNQACSDCLSAKTRQQNKPTKAHSAPTAPLQELQIDIQGPLNVMGIDGTRYNSKIICGKTGFCWETSIDDTSSEATALWFERLRKYLERQFPQFKIQFVRRDGGSEHAKKFTKLLKDLGIVQKVGTPYLHRVPPMAERKHQTIMGRSKASIKSSKLPMPFITEAIKCVGYCDNRFSVGNTKSPYEKLYGKPPKTDHFIPFGAIGYAFVPAEKRKKTDDTRRKCIMMGYGDEDGALIHKQGYRLFDPETYQFFYSDDVKFQKPYLFETLQDFERHWSPSLNAENTAFTPQEVDEIQDGKILGSRLVFTWKLNADGSYLAKCRLVAQGFDEEKGIDYDEWSAPVVKYQSMRVLLCSAASKGHDVFQDDVKAAYLNAVLKIRKWMRLPNGKYVYLKKALYGLVEAGVEWYNMLKKHMEELGFNVNAEDPCIFQRGELTVAIYVDDVLSIGPLADIQKFRAEFRAKFQLSKDGGEAKWYLGMTIHQSQSGIELDQNLYVANKLQEFSHLLDPHVKRETPLPVNYQDILQDASETDFDTSFPMRQVMGSLIHAAMGTRFDIVTAVNICCQHVEKPRKAHIELVKRILYYLRAYPRKSIFYKANQPMILSSYVDASYANDADYASRGGFAFLLGGSIVSWRSGKIPGIQLSSAESEFCQLTIATKELIGLKRFLDSLGYPQDTIDVLEDNQACIALATNPQKRSKRTAHIQVKYFWVNEQIKKGVFRIVYCPTKSQLGDMFTKGLPKASLHDNMAKLGLVDTRKEEES